jgi:Glycosyl hydrolases family 43/CARDB
MPSRYLAFGLLVPLLALAARGRADLTVSGVSATRAGERLLVTDTVRNLGTRRTPPTRVEYRLVGPAGRTRVLATRTVPSLAPGRASRGTARITVRASSYRVLACVDSASRVRESDEANNCAESMPPPVIGARPDDPTAATEAQFSFSHRWRGVRFTCRFDDGAPEACTSPVAFTGLAEGDHRFSVTAWRGARRLGATTVYRWTVDTTSPPAPVISNAPAALSNRRDAEFAFADRDAEATFRCAVDGAPARPCTSPQRHALGDGGHTFAVMAVDPAGNTSAPRAVEWTIDATPPPAPSIDDAPEAASGDTSARFGFTDSEAGVRFSCRLDDGPTVPCSSPVDYGDLSDGAHQFTVAARDAAGNTAGATRAWTIRLRPGAATGPPVTVQPTSATVSGTVTPNGKPTSYFVEYGTGTSYDLRSAVAPAGSQPVDVPVQVLLTGLSAATMYHYRVVATTCGGCAAGTSRGAEATLTTPPAETYTNPVYGGLADPMGLHDLGDFYTYGTGELFPVLHSTDLVHWTQVGTALSRRPAWVPQTGQWNPWAPSVLRRDGACPGTTSPACYFMYYTGLNESLATDANCIGVAISASPTGPFTDTGILDTDPSSIDAEGRPIGCGDAAGYSNIDAAPFIDPADGAGYLYLSTGHEPSGAWRRTISVIPLTADLLHAAGPRQPLFSMTQPWERDVVEGPWMTHHRNGYYLLYSGASFTDASYAMGYAYASSPTGPFVKPSSEPILKSTADVIGPGGGSVITGPRGDDWLVYHGRAAPGGARTLRIDPLVWNDAADPPSLTVRGPTTSPQPRP